MVSSYKELCIFSQKRQFIVAGMYTMRLLDSNNSNNASSSVGSLGTAVQPSEERMDASSDSAVSSMGSERVPSLSDGEWMETGSDSGHTTGDHYAMDYHAR
jgi:nuclear factor erythroid 2